MPFGTTVLVPVTGVPTALQYDLQALPGAMAHAYVAEPVLEVLQRAAARVRQAGHGAQLVVWDAYRTPVTQRAIFDDYRSTLIAPRPGLSPEQLHDAACAFVSDPNGVFPHGTGGAVDVTLFIDGAEAWLGTGFDDFTPRAARDFFRIQPPAESRDEEAHRNRELLRDAMETSGFVGLDSEWWHYEWGTARWAAQRVRDVLLDVVLPPAQAEGRATAARAVPDRLPVLELGVAPPFLTGRDRAEALAHMRPAHYYARASNATSGALGAVLAREIFDAEATVLLPSGLAAVIATVTALVPPGGTLMYSSDVYYECELAFRRHAAARGWTLLRRPSVNRALQSGEAADVVYVESPSNWFLQTHDLPALARLTHERDALLVVDVTLQPCQPALAEGADVVGELALEGCFARPDTGRRGRGPSARTTGRPRRHGARRRLRSVRRCSARRATACPIATRPPCRPDHESRRHRRRSM